MRGAVEMKIEAEFDVRERIRGMEDAVEALSLEVWKLKEAVMRHTHPGLFEQEADNP